MTSRSMPTVPQGDRLVGRTGWLAAVLVMADGGVHIAGHLPQMGPRPRIPAVGDRGQRASRWRSSSGMIVFFENPFAQLWQTFDGNIDRTCFQPAGQHALHPRRMGRD
ncbi:MAG: hypothetical protein MZV64_19800 [Ignavibacteriales bacterium]|nr:hypothetical protein [Ignavibacteriales bacterium]